MPTFPHKTSTPSVYPRRRTFCENDIWLSEQPVSHPHLIGTKNPCLLSALSRSYPVAHPLRTYSHRPSPHAPLTNDSGSSGQQVRRSSLHGLRPSRHYGFHRRRRVFNSNMDRYLLQAQTGIRLPPKTIYLVRHGESTHNAQSLYHLGADSNNAAYLDAPLTGVGQQQARALVNHMPRLGSQLIVTSPLTRATQTCLLATAAIPQPFSPLVHPLCAERVASVGDIGSPVRELQERFPALDYSRLGPNDCWWWTPGGTTRGQSESLKHLWRYSPGAERAKEPHDFFLARVNAFRRWLLGRPETVITVFAHGVFLMQLMGPGTAHFRNAEVRRLVL